MNRRPRRNGGMLYLLALHVASEFMQTDRKPPVTAGLIAANTLIYLRPGPLNEMLPTLSEACLNPYLVFKNKDFRRLFLSAFYHVDDSHLVYNMLSLLWKGLQLERMMGSTAFASMVAMLLGLSHGILVASAKVLDAFFDYPHAWKSECSIGFSSVLFALKVVLNANSPDYTNVYGVIVPAKYAAWAELVLIQMFVPGVSFLGHLSGILAGIIYTKLRRYLGGSNPLTLILQKLASFVASPWRFVKNQFFGERRRLRGHGTVGGRRTPNLGYTGALWRCPQCTYDNNIFLETCEMCGAGRIDVASGPSAPLEGPFQPAHGSSHDLSLEELRRLRVERFDRRY
eukprot:TRINITY_DN29537_c0_g1_i1.p1 TRINITY_DN29537_c0_g1~~TRINITY_DN29537_c0_g1_i1.p1  ORF type:complete len:342 (-),score=41.72 TRINITY_DN29537_c0_g1_i1:50-1075(-)